MITLVIWEQIPETTDLFLIPNSEIDDEMRGIMQRAHGKLINADEDVEDALKLNAAFSPKNEKYPVDDEYLPYWGRFAQYRAEENGPIQNTHVTHIYMSGWVL